MGYQAKEILPVNIEDELIQRGDMMFTANLFCTLEEVMYIFILATRGTKIKLENKKIQTLFLLKDILQA